MSADHKFGDFNVDGFIGGNVYYWKSDNILGETQNGLKIPGYYSLKSSIDPVKTTSGITKKLVTSVYAKASVSWKSTLFLDVTGRNDWSSSLPSETRSYFYPSVAGSVVLSQFIPMPEVIDFWKVRGHGRRPRVTWEYTIPTILTVFLPIYGTVRAPHIIRHLSVV